MWLDWQVYIKTLYIILIIINLNFNKISCCISTIPIYVQTIRTHLYFKLKFKIKLKKKLNKILKNLKNQGNNQKETKPQELLMSPYILILSLCLCCHCHKLHPPHSLSPLSRHTLPPFNHCCRPSTTIGSCCFCCQHSDPHSLKQRLPLSDQFQ